MVAYDELIEIPYILACAAPSCDDPKEFFQLHWVDNDGMSPSQVDFNSQLQVNSLLALLLISLAVRLQSPPN